MKMKITRECLGCSVMCCGGVRGGEIPLTRLGDKIRQSRLEIYVNTNSQEIVLTKAQKMHKAFPC